MSSTRLAHGAPPQQTRREGPSFAQSDPPPAGGTFVGAAEDEVDLGDRHVAERLTPVRTTALVALVRQRRPGVRAPAGATRWTRPATAGASALVSLVEAMKSNI